MLLTVSLEMVSSTTELILVGKVYGYFINIVLTSLFFDINIKKG